MKKKVVIILGVILILAGLGFLGYYVYLEIVGEAKYLSIKLVGDKEITIDYGEEYKDKGAKAYYKKNNISKDIEVDNNLDLAKLGSYKYTYSIKHKKQFKEIDRVVNIVDNDNPTIELIGDANINLYVGDKYEEKGAKATDNYDGDITDKIETTGAVDTSKDGEYTITYKIKDSSGNEASIERKIKIIKKPVPVAPANSSGGAKVAVLNYHFFYASWDEGCHESICEDINKFKEQVRYLKDNNFKILTMKEFIAWMYGEIDLPSKSVLITIDDGAHGTGKHNGNHLIPALEELEVPATLFLITGWWDISNYQSKYLNVESHTHDLHHEANCGHRSKVNCVGYDNLLADLRQSIAITNKSDSFCFPFYDYTEESIRAVKEAGFKVAFIGGNRKATRNDNKYKIPRYIIYNSTSLQQFKNMVN